MRIDYIERRGNALTRSSIQCLKQVASINPVLGCIHQCVYCYARGYSMYPGDGKVLVYKNIAEKLKKELSARRRLPDYVFFSPACDAMQPVPQILSLTYESMYILLEHGIGINLLTKGRIPLKFLQLFGRHRGLVHVQIGITTLNRDIQRKFEPYATTPHERIMNIERLRSIHIVPEVKLDPLIPGVTDTRANLMSLFGALHSCGITSASVNYLFLRPQIKRNLYDALKGTSYLPKIFMHYRDGNLLNLRAKNSRVVALCADYRNRSYQYITDLARNYGIDVYVCGCKNPDTTEDLLCGIKWKEQFKNTPAQKRLL